MLASLYRYSGINYFKTVFERLFNYILYSSIFIKLLECCGNLYDACALASKFALSKAKLPQLIIKSDDEGQVEIDINDDISKHVNLKVDELPYSVSVCKIGQNFVVDADLKEESVAKVRLTFGFDKSGNIRYSSKDGFGSLDPDTLYSIIDV